MKKLYFLLLLSSFASAQFTWTPLPSAAVNTNGQRFDDVFFLNENVGWAANGFFAAVYKTTDGGINWTLQTNNAILGSNHYFRNIEFLDENIGFLGTLNGKFYKTLDGGNTWNLVTITPNPFAICGLDCVGTSTVYGCGAYFSPACIIKSTDSGITWQYINMSTYANTLVEVLFLDESNGYAAGNNDNGAVILKTQDGGITWSTLYNGTISGEYVWKLQVLQSNANVLFGAVSSVSPNNGKLIKSVDGGLNWSTKIAPEVDVQAVGFISENHGWMGGHTTGFYETIDGGDSWTNTTVGSNLNRIFVLNDNFAYASGTTIYKMSNTLSLAPFTEQFRVPIEVRVAPNPIKDKLNLELDFLGQDHLIIGIYSLNGHLIKELNEGEIKQAMTKKIVLDFPYPAGTYFLNFHTDTGRQSLKIVK